MEKTINDRIVEICRVKNFNQSDLVRKNLASKQTISYIFRSRQKPSWDFLEGFFKLVSRKQMIWIVTGDDQILNEKDDLDIVEQSAAEYGNRMYRECRKELDTKLEESGALKKELELVRRENEELRHGDHASGRQDLPKSRAG